MSEGTENYHVIRTEVMFADVKSSIWKLSYYGLVGHMSLLEHGPALVVCTADQLYAAALIRGALDGTRYSHVDPLWQAELMRATRYVLKGVQQVDDALFIEMVAAASHGRLSNQGVRRMLNAFSTVSRILAGAKESVKDADQLHRLQQDMELLRHAGLFLVILHLPHATDDNITSDSQLEESTLCICAGSTREGRLWKLWEAPVYASDFALNRDAEFINLQVKALALSLIANDRTVGMPMEAREALEQAMRVLIIRSIWDLTPWIKANEDGVFLTEDLLKYIQKWNN